MQVYRILDVPRVAGFETHGGAMAWMLVELGAKGARFGIGSVPKLSMGRARVPVPHVKHRNLNAKMTAVIFCTRIFVDKVSRARR